ncbi:unnamed protein product [Closterium sp. NIES-65]|nr:unnamed protein product [Closterium sp. NIES-65]
MRGASTRTGGAELNSSDSDAGSSKAKEEGKFRMTRMERDSPPGQPEEQHGKLVEERSKPLKLVSRLDMVHYLNVTGGWDEDLRECCFERAVSQRALAINNLEDLRRHLRVQKPRCIPAADPKQQQDHAISP